VELVYVRSKGEICILIRGGHTYQVPLMNELYPQRQTYVLCLYPRFVTIGYRCK
jgi:hypothetical protein